MSKDIIKKYNQLASEVPQKEPISFDLNHIPVPNLHPDPSISIQLHQLILDIIEHKDSFGYFKKSFGSLDIEGKFFFSKYFLEYWDDTNYKSFIKTNIKDISKPPTETKWDDSESFSNWKNRLFNQPLSDYKEKLNALFKVYEDLSLNFSFLKIEVQRLYQNKLKSIDSKYLDDFSIFSARDLNHNDFRVDITNNYEEYIFKVRELFPTKFDNLAIDSFISNSFSYPTNNAKIEMLSLSFGNRNETNIVFHNLYNLHKEIVKSPKVIKLDFARLMFLNIKFIRDNFIKNSSTSFDLKSLDSYLNRSVAKNIRPDIPLRA